MRSLFKLMCFYYLSLVLIGCELFENNENEDDPPYTSPINYSNTTITWGPEEGIIKIEQDIIIDSTSTLRILPGTTIEYAEATVLVPDPAGDMLRSPRITVLGNLIANGHEDNKITFLPIGDNKPNFRIYNNIDHTYDTQMQWVNGIGYTQIMDSRPIIRNCNMSAVHIEGCESVRIEENIITGLAFWRTTGMVIENQISGSILSLTGSIKFEGNTIDSEEQSYYGFRSQNDDSSIFISNTINNRLVAIYLFSGSPRINRNNITNYDISVKVQPHTDSPDSDTLDFSNNWWGTSNLDDIRESIIYEQNGDTDSEKQLVLEPIATEPFE